MGTLRGPMKSAEKSDRLVIGALVPIGAMWVFASMALLAVGPIALVGVALACLPYCVLAGGVLATGRRVNVRQMIVCFAVPLLALLLLDGWIIIEHMLVVARSRSRAGRESLSPEALTATLLGVSGIVAAVLLAAWVLVVYMLATWRSGGGAWRTRPADECPECRYDWSGIPAGAVCPECGAASERA